MFLFGQKGWIQHCIENTFFITYTYTAQIGPYPYLCFHRRLSHLLPKHNQLPKRLVTRLGNADNLSQIKHQLQWCKSHYISTWALKSHKNTSTFSFKIQLIVTHSLRFCLQNEDRFGAIQVLRNAFPEKSVTKVYGSTLLALRGGGWGQISRKNSYVTLEWPLFQRINMC